MKACVGSAVPDAAAEVACQLSLNAFGASPSLFFNP